VNPQGDPKSLSTVSVGIISGLLLLIVIFALQLLYYWLEGNEAQIKDGDPRAAFETLRNEQQGLLEGGYYWIDEEKGVVAIPIERAMARVVAEAGEAMP